MQSRAASPLEPRDAMAGAHGPRRPRGGGPPLVRVGRSLLTAVALLSLSLLPAGAAPRPPDFEKVAQASGVRTCQAADSAAFKACMEQIYANLVDHIVVTRLIDCTGSADLSCGHYFQPRPVQPVNRPISISGAPNSGAGFRRLDNHWYYVLYVGQFKGGVTISNLVFDETTRACDSSCASTIALVASDNVTVDGVTIYYAKNHGIEISGGGSSANNITVKNSTLVNNGMFGIWMDNTAGSVASNVHIANNLIKDVRSNGVLFAGVGSAANPSTVTGNTFIHDHRDAVFHVCGPSGNAPCAGGQLLISNKTNYLRVESNIIKEGIMDEYDSHGLKVSGIEFENYGINNVTITGNDIHKNTGPGVIINFADRYDSVSNISIRRNKIYANSSAIQFPGADKIAGLDIGENCSSATCSPMLLRGDMYAYPPCISTGGATSCTTTLTWTSNDASKRSVVVRTSDGRQFAKADGGSQAATVTGDGTTFQLYSGTTLLDTLFVKRVVR